MSDLLLELFSEEIPARMQARAAEDLRRLVTDGLVAQGFTYEGARTFVTPRRLTLAIHGLPIRGADVREERKGPRVGAPQAAIDGFLKSAGLTSIDQATIQSDPKKGDSYIAVTERPGRATTEVLAQMLPGIIRAFPWPKSMRWGAASGPEGRAYVRGAGKGSEALRWVRPLRSILCTYGSEHEEPEVVQFAVDDITSGNITFGHRFMSDGAPITVKRLDDYLAKLEAAKVIADPARRRETILHEARQLCFAQGLELVEDEALADEVAGLVEWPVPLMGSFEEAFLEVPPEVIRTTIRANQKCFVVRRNDGALANRFIATANVEASDGGAMIIAGNARVIRARLSDARFFWQTDRKVKLLDRLEKLKSVRFHEKLGTQYERVERIAALAEEIAPLVGANPKLAKEAAYLAKADLATEMVGEFPELQGLMGRYYATLEGHRPEVAAALEEHYKPQGPSDTVPTSPVSVAVALADKLDTLVGFWAINEKPTGSKDPYALRRAALGCIAIAIRSNIDLYPRGIFESHIGRVRPEWSSENSYVEWAAIADDFQWFFEDRLKVQLRESGKQHQLVDAVLRLKSSEVGLATVVNRVNELWALLATENGKNLLAGYKRAANILRAEEKRDGDGAFEDAPEGLNAPEETALAASLDAAQAQVSVDLANEDYEAAMKRMAGLRPSVDAFFETILVNDPDPVIRLNRLRLLAQLRRVTSAVADFSKISG